MNTRILNRLMAIQNFTMSVIVSMVMLATFSFLVSAQAATNQPPSVTLVAIDAASSVPVIVDSASSVPATTDATTIIPAFNTPRIRTTFDHLNTGFPLIGAHIAVSCETCHVNGVFKGTPKNCAGCHTTGRYISALPKNQDHIPTTKACEACHISASSFRTVVMDHTGSTLDQGCATCHSGNYDASGVKKSNPYDGTHNDSNVASLSCSVCHNTFSFAGAKLNHSNYTNGCTACHKDGNVVAPLGKIASSHISTFADCETCHTPTLTPGWPLPLNFTGAVIDHTKIEGATCSSCHDGSLARITTKPSNHISTSFDCNACHTTAPALIAAGKFKVWTMDHAGIATGCDSCHNGQSFATAVKPVSKSSTHIVTTAPCENCHSSTTTPGGFATWTMSHAGITSGCNTCHKSSGNSSLGGATVIGIPSGHVVTTAACETCHSTIKTNVGDFAANWTMNHAANGNTANCATCHDGQTFPTAVVPVNKTTITNHVSTTAACETCHSNTNTSIGGFASNIAMNHTGITAACASCHLISGDTTVGSIVVKGLPSGHLAITTACESCHSTTTPGGFATWTMNHALNGNTTACASCHANNVTLLNAPTLVTLSLTAHVPVGSVACESCHTATSTSSGAFTTSALPMGTAAHNLVSGTACATCHDTSTSFTGVKTKSTAHFATTAACDVCHTQVVSPNFANFLGATFDHTTIGSATCTSCHGGNAIGVMAKSASHIATTLECNVCHTTALASIAKGGFKTWTMSHTGITSNCASCHTGATVDSTVVMGKPTYHIATTAACENCHSITSTSTGGFAAPNWTMSHTGITSNCASCHTGATAGSTVVMGKPTNHIATTAACEICHSTTSTSTDGFAAPNWTMNHTGITSGCVTCHKSTGNATITGKVATTVIGAPTGHIAIIAACETCHTSTTTPNGFATWTMDHAANSNTSACATCHANGKTLPNTPSLVTLSTTAHVPVGSIACESCHTASNTITGGFATSALPMGTTAHNLVSATSCETCHDTSKTYTGVTTKSSSHIPTTASCISCHTQANTGGFTSFLNATFDHTTIGSTVCSSCHSGLIKGIVAKPSYHIATALECNICHTTTPAAITTGSFKTWTMNHATNGNTTNCASCHAQSGDVTLGTAVVKGKPTVHIVTAAACETCHTNTTTPGGFATWSMSHTGITANCASCHSGATVGTTVVMGKPTFHITTTAACESCHSISSTNTGGFAAPNWTMNHSGIVSDCASCHTGATAGTTVVMGKPTNHISTTAACETCHFSTSTSTGGFAAPNWTMNHTGITTGCVSCHKSTGNSSIVNPGATTTVIGVPTGHIAITAACETCHTSTTTPGGFATWTMNHTANGNTTACATCHANGTTLPNTPSLVTLSTTAHVPVGSVACELCHTASSTAAGGFATSALPMGITAHTLVSATACETCHDTSKTYTGVTTKSGSHIPTTATCVSCHTQSNTNGFTTFLNATFDHTTIGSATCSSCHGGAINGIVAKPSFHISTPLECNVCHTTALSAITTGSFTTWTMSHTGITSNCASCHAQTGDVTLGTVVVKGKPTVHIATTAACETCHSTTSTSTGGFAAPNWTMNHTGLTSNCASCHLQSGDQTVGTATVKGKPTVHITTTAACETCHTTTTTPGGFATWTMNHTGMTSNCASCHLQTGDATVGTTLVKGKPTVHITTTAACESCHTSTATGGFATWSMSHVGITSSCASCHLQTGDQTVGTTTVKGKPTIHIATTAACESCHSISSTNSGGFAAPNWTMNHTGLSTNCASCHLASGDTTVGTTTVKGKPTSHVTTTLACESCHTNTSSGGFSSWTMNHIANGNTSNCANCHTGVTQGNAVVMGKPTTHISTIAACETCHSTTSTSIGGFASPSWAMGITGHNNVTAGARCDSCHNGQSFQGVTMVSSTSILNPHPVSIQGQDCGTCHGSVTSFLATTTYSHLGIAAGTCSTCHDNSSSLSPGLGKTPGHLATVASCDVCHTDTANFTSFRMVSGFNHAAPAAATWGSHQCGSSCHNNSANYKLTGAALSPTHVNVGLTSIPVASCDSCHGTTTTFLNAVMNHAGITSGCSTCHDGQFVVVLAKPTGTGGHIATSAACETCHASTSTSVGGFAAPNWTMNHTGLTTGCASCHGGQTFKGSVPNPPVAKPSNHITTTAACEACHSNTSTGGFATWTMSHAGITTDCVSCHTGAIVGTTVVMGKPSFHIATTAACETCHPANKTSTGNFAAPNWTMNHAGITTGCASCHTGAAVGTTVIMGKPSFHIATTAACETCHASAKTSTGDFAAPNWTMSHTGITTGCASCHKSTGDTTVGSATVKGAPSGHIAITAACESCHTSTTTPGGFATWTMDHTANGNTSACATCHDNGKTLFNAPTLVTLSLTAHVPVTGIACESCHTAGSTSAGGFATSALPMVTAGHTLVSGTACSVCHDTGKVFTGVVTKSSAHIATTATCNSCHTQSNTVGFTTFLNATFNHATIGAAVCSSCHGGSIAGIVAKPSNHVPTTLECNVCHTVSLAAITTGSFETWTMSHTGITTGCTTCHASGVSFKNTSGTALVTLNTGNHIPVGSTACENCHTSTTTPRGFETWTMNHTGFTTGCAACHATGLSFKNTSGTPIVVLSTTTHVPVGSLACESCHKSTGTNTGNFNSATYWTMGTAGHALVNATPCATCHGTAGASFSGVKTWTVATHLATTATCDTCHTASNTSGYANFLGAMGAHTSNPVPSLGATCVSCHSGGTAGTVGTGGGKNMIANHVPIAALDCGACHNWTSFPVWTAPTVHTAVTGTACSTCHDAGKTYVGVVTKSNPAITHIATTAACDTCHTSTVSPGGFATWTMSHTGITTGCASCHASGVSFQNTSGTPLVTLNTSNHIPVGTTACETCHTSTTTPRGFETWTMSHAGITSGCATCHKSGASFKNTSGTPLVTLSTTTHVPVGTLACESCHKNTGVNAGNFNSTTYWTMGTAGHALVNSTPCANCHGTAGASFSGVKIWTVATHISTTAACDTCHTSTNTSGFTTFLGALGAHTSNPVPSLGATCLICHTGGTAGGLGTGGGKNMIANHVPIGALDCSACHGFTSFTTWTAATVHTAVKATTTCANCHDAGKTYVGVVTKSSPAITHIATTIACDSCHTSTVSPGGFKTWTMNHAANGNTTACATCHAANATAFTNTGGTAIVKLSTTIHVPTGTIACEGCHSTTVVTTGAFATAWTMGAAGHTLVATTACAACHGTAASAYTGVKIISSAHMPSSYYPAQDCGTNCHTAASSSNYAVGGFTLLNMAANVPSHTGTGVSPYMCANCHNNSIAAGTTSVTGFTHMAISADCVTCHTQTNTSGYANFLGATAGHDTSTAGIAAAKNNCGYCHKTGGSGKMFTSQHIPSGTPSATDGSTTKSPAYQCDQCHTTSYTTMSFATATMTHTSGTSYPASATCGATGTGCHTGAYKTEGNVAGAQGISTYITNHIPTTITGSLDCNTCHTGVPVVSATGFLNEKMNHNGATTGCVVCHLKGVTYLATGISRTNHNSASAAKDCSSSKCHKPLGTKGTAYSKWN